MDSAKGNDYIISLFDHQKIRKYKMQTTSLKSFKSLLFVTLPVATMLTLGACSAKPDAPTKNETKPTTNETTQITDKYMSNITQLTHEGDNGEAYFSYDGTKLIYQSSRGGYKCDKIWTMNPDGSDKTMVSPDHGAHTCSFIMPGKDKIIYSSTANIEGACPVKPEFPAGTRYAWPFYRFDIFMADMDGSNPVNLTDDNEQYDAEPVISADGKSIVFGSIRNGDFDIYTMDTDGSNVRRLTDKVGYDGGPWFSPDASKIVWRAWHPETKEDKARWAAMIKGEYVTAVPLDLWVMNADGSDKIRLTKNGATNWAPSWHPDGKRVIFSSNMDDWREDIKAFGHNFEIYLIDIETKELERVTYNDVFDSFPMFRPDGKKIVFGSNRNPDKPRATDIYIADWQE